MDGKIFKYFFFRCYENQVGGCNVNKVRIFNKVGGKVAKKGTFLIFQIKFGFKLFKYKFFYQKSQFLT